MKSLRTSLVSAGMLLGFAAATPVHAQVSDTFTLMEKGKVVETLTLTDAEEGTSGAVTTFSTLFPKGTRLVGAEVPGDAASFAPHGNNKLILQVFSDGDKGGGNDPGESTSLSIVKKNGKPSQVADTLLIGSDKPVPAVPEPRTIGLLCAGLVGLGFWLRMRVKHR